MNWGFLEDNNQSWLDDNDNDELDVEELELLEELGSNEQEDDGQATLDDLLSALDDLDDLEAQDGNLGWNAVMKVCFLSALLFFTHHVLLL